MGKTIYDKTIFKTCFYIYWNKNSELFWIKRKQVSIDDEQLKLLWKQLNFKREENDLIIWGQLENPSLPHASKAPYLINLYHQLAKLIVTDTHNKKLKHTSVKETLKIKNENEHFFDIYWNKNYFR